MAKIYTVMEKVPGPDTVMHPDQDQYFSRGGYATLKAAKAAIVKLRGLSNREFVISVINPVDNTEE